jgi:tRNA dimethylallyltransferase
LGPTASGKTALACQLAAQIKGEIISADSRQVYRHMDIGTGKDLDEYMVHGHEIPYHLIDIKPPGYAYNIAEFQEDFIQAFHSIENRKHFPILCGGSGLYIETALRGHSFLGIPPNESLQKELEIKSDESIEAHYNQLPDALRSKLNAKTRKRKIRAIIIQEYLIQHPNFKAKRIPDFQPLIIGVSIDRLKRREKITRRLKDRLENGMIEEVKTLLSKHGLTPEQLAYYGLEYKWVGSYLKGEIDRETLFERLNIAIHQFAKRQMTWFRKMEKDGFDIHWIDAQQTMDSKVKEVLHMLQQ